MEEASRGPLTPPAAGNKAPGHPTACNPLYAIVAHFPAMHYLLRIFIVLVARYLIE